MHHGLGLAVNKHPLTNTILTYASVKSFGLNVSNPSPPRMTRMRCGANCSLPTTLNVCIGRPATSLPALLANLTDYTSTDDGVVGYDRRTSFHRPSWQTTSPETSSMASGPNTCVAGRPDAVAISSAVRAPRPGNAS